MCQRFVLVVSIFSIVLGPSLLAAQTAMVGQSVSQQIVTFQDPNLEAVIRESISKPEGDILLSDVSELKVLTASSKDIVSLSGIENLTSLTNLGLDINHITDISPLSTLTSLTELRLNVNQISDISPLSNLKFLTRLSLITNQISGLSPLSTLTSLTELGLSSNQISDISPLSNLTSLTILRGNMSQRTICAWVVFALVLKRCPRSGIPSSNNRLTIPI